MPKKITKTAPIVVHRKPNQVGKWVYKPLKSKVIICKCGNKYIITRDKQVMCILCSRGK